jgi:iron complex outermembrane receptor protein
MGHMTSAHPTLLSATGAILRETPVSSSRPRGWRTDFTEWGMESSTDQGRRGAAALARLKGTASLLMLAAGTIAGPAWAQQTDAQQLPPTAPQTPEAVGAPDVAADGQASSEDDVIVVTGFRSSLRASLTEKRNADGVVDVIKAEDIADFPDNNLAESIQRIPGVAITRDAGEGRNISVRGLSPLFTRVRINGIEGLSTAGGADASGGANRGRQFDFNVFASDLFNSITVRKTPSADIEEGSLGATVDLVTARPFDYRDDFTAAGTAQMGFSDFANGGHPRVAGLVSGKFADGRIGVLLSAAYSERNILEEGPSTVRWEQGTASGGFNAASTLPEGASGFGFFHPRIPRYDSYKYDTKRLGLTGSIQFQPTDRTLITIDALYADFKSNRTEQYLEAISFSRSGAGKPQTVILPGAVVDDSNSLVSGEFDNVDIRVESRFDELRTKFKQFTAALSHEFTDRFKVNLLAGTSKSDFSNPIQTTVALDVANVDGYSFDFSDGRLPTFDYGDLDVTDATRFSLGEIRLRPQFVENDFKVFRGEGAYEFSQALTLKAGADFKKYGFDSKEFRRNSETQVPVLPPGMVASLTTLYTINTSLPGNTPQTFVVPNLDRFADALDIYSGTGMFELFGIERSTPRSNWRTVDEKDLGLYAQGDFNLELGGVRLRGNVGARWVKTRQTSTGYTGDGPTLTLVEAKRSYSNFLPALNIAADISSDFVLRGAVAKVISRPDIGTLNPGGAFSISGANVTFNRGNPDLDPTEATTYDLSAEWYFAPESALIVGLFYKDISTFVATTTQPIPFNQLGLPDSLIEGTTVQPTDNVTVNQPINSKGGTLKGLELGLQMPFRFLPAPLDNFGMLANYTYVSSKIEYPISTAAGAAVVKDDLVGLSRHTANGTLYYEDKKFSIRGSISYRSGFLTQVPGRNGVSATLPDPDGAGPLPAPPNPDAGQPTFNDVEGTNSSINIDMSASYAITPNFSVTFEGVNLTDEYVDQYIDSEGNRLSTYHHTGRQFYAGVRFKF